MPNTHPSIERCTNEIPLSADPTACDAVVCGAPADVETEAGPRCYSCFEEYGGELVSSAQPVPSTPSRVKLDFGLTMSNVIDSLFPVKAVR